MLGCEIGVIACHSKPLPEVKYHREKIKVINKELMADWTISFLRLISISLYHSILYDMRSYRLNAHY